MAVVNGYITFDEFDSYLAAANNGNTVGTANRRTEMENAVNAASRMIDKHCGRIFYDAGQRQPVGGERAAGLSHVDGVQDRFDG